MHERYAIENFFSMEITPLIVACGTPNKAITLHLSLQLWLLFVYGDQFYHKAEEGFKETYKMLVERYIHIQWTTHSH